MSNELITALQSAAGNAGSFYPYTVDYSCRFNDGDSPYLTRTQATPTSAGVWTFSTWIKLVSPSDSAEIFASGPNVSNYERVTFTGSTSTFYWDKTQSGIQRDLLGNANVSHRDPSGWLHLLVRKNGTTASEIIVNGASLDTHTPSAFTNYMNVASTEQNIARLTASYPNNYGDYYLSQVAFVDGQYLDYDDFTELKNGVLCPSNLSGITWGNNGFLLDFGNSAALGTDVSGNGNNFTSSGLAANDQVTDTPTNNYPTFNPLKFRTTATKMDFSNGNLVATGSGTTPNEHAYGSMLAPTGADKHWYFEVEATTVATEVAIGICDPNTGWGGNPEGYNYRNNGNKQENGTSGAAYGDTYTSGDVIGVRVDGDNIYFYKNGTIQNSGTAAYTDCTTKFPNGFVVQVSGRASDVCTLDAGQHGFAHTVPTGALEINSTNLPEPTIGPNSDIKPDEVFEPILYTGNGTSQSISTLEFQPDFTWIKNRDAADKHMLFDAVRGATKYLSSNSTNAEATDAQSLSSFNSNGFSVGNNVQVNTNAEDYVAWNWKENSEFFDIVTWTGTGGAGTISHNLNGTPDMGVVKRRDAADSWYFMSPVTSNYTNPAYGSLNTSGAFLNSGSGITNWNSTDISYASYYGGSGDKWVLYLWKNLDGMCKCGSYTGNGSSDGPMIFTGMRPAFVLVKSSTYAGTFWLMSADPNEYNVVDTYLAADSSNAEFSPYTWIDYLSNGFKLRQTGDSLNRSGQTYIYMAFAENPFKYANAR